MLPQLMLAMAGTATPASSQRIPPTEKGIHLSKTDTLVHYIVTHRAQASFEHGTTARQNILSTAIRQLLIGRYSVLQHRRAYQPTHRSMELGPGIDDGGRIGTLFPQE